MRNDASNNKMHPLFRPFRIVFAVGLLMVFASVPVAFAVCSENSSPRVVMTIGDSLTLGWPFGDWTSGYRAAYISSTKGLYELLDDAGLKIDYVGSQLDSLNCKHESMAGQTITEIDDLLTKSDWKTDLMDFQPNIILLMAGTNDFLQNYCPSKAKFAEDVVDELLTINGQTGLVEDIFNKLPNAQLFIASIPSINISSGWFDSKCVLDIQKVLPNLPAIDRIKYQDDLNTEIQKFNQAIKDTVNKDGRQNLHFVDVGSVLTLNDLGDGVHPKEPILYQKMAIPWASAIVDLYYKEKFLDAKNLVNSNWNNPQNWKDRVQLPGVPQNGDDVYLTQDDSVDRVVTYDSGDNFGFTGVTIDAMGTGNMTLLQEMNNFKSVLEVVGDQGYGGVFQSGGIATLNTVLLGSKAGSEGNYIFTNSALLEAVSENIGWAGTGYFIQGGGTNNNILRQLLVGWPSGTSGKYDLHDGTLSANEEYIGSRKGTAVFTQTGGINSVEAKSPTAGGVEGTLWIAAAGDAPKDGLPYTYSGTYNMVGGSLTAKRIVNDDLFYYPAGEVTVTDNFTNNGTLHVVGPRVLTGNYVQNSSGQLSIDIFSGNPGQLKLMSGKATLNGGSVKVSFDKGVNLNVGDNFDILIANDIQGFGMGLFKLPLLAGGKVVRPSLVGATIRLTIVSADLNGNGAVDCSDLAIVKASLGKRVGQPGYNTTADINGDGVVDVRDLSIITQKLPAGTRCP